MSNSMIINPFNSDNSNITNSKAQLRQIITAITDRVLKVEPMIKKIIVTDDTSLTVITFVISFT